MNLYARSLEYEYRRTNKCFVGIDLQCAKKIRSSNRVFHGHLIMYIAFPVCDQGTVKASKIEKYICKILRESVFMDHRLRNFIRSQNAELPNLS
jgi:hypothetical protein